MASLQPKPSLQRIVGNICKVPAGLRNLTVTNATFAQPSHNTISRCVRVDSCRPSPMDRCPGAPPPAHDSGFGLPGYVTSISILKLASTWPGPPPVELLWSANSPAPLVSKQSSSYLVCSLPYHLHTSRMPRRSSLSSSLMSHVAHAEPKRHSLV